MTVHAFLKKHHAGLHRYDFAVTLIIISVLATLLLYSLNRIQRNIETLTHEAELNNIRLAITENWVHKHARHEAVNVKDLVNTNPMRFINEVPKNYIGEKSAKPMDLYSVWYFDTQKKQLVYVYSDDTEARYALTNTATRKSTSLLSTGGLDLAPIVNQ
jgi:type II secretory pathway pseudopilin PulG